MHFYATIQPHSLCIFFKRPCANCAIILSFLHSNSEISPGLHLGQIGYITLYSSVYALVKMIPWTQMLFGSSVHRESHMTSFFPILNKLLARSLMLICHFFCPISNLPNLPRLLASIILFFPPIFCFLNTFEYIL